MSDTIIHVGLPKTGSTFIQNQVLEPSDEIFYVGRPYTQEGTAFNMIQYADDTIYDDDLVRSELMTIKRQSDGKKLVVSDELLSGSPLYGLRNRTSTARRLQEYFPNAEIVLCLRNQVDILTSYFRQITDMGWNMNALDEKYVHEAGNGLPFEDWQYEMGWDTSRRFVSHHSWMSIEYFKYTKLFDLYDNLFDQVTVLLFEDFQEKRDPFFEEWARIAGIEVEVIRERSQNQVNTRGTNYVGKLLSNRVDMLIKDMKWVGDKMIHKLLPKALRPFFCSDIFGESYLTDLVNSAGIPEDNENLADRGIVDLTRHAERYGNIS